MAKTFFKDGKWIDSPKETVITVCHCTNKFILTRIGQIECLECTRIRAARTA